MACEPSPCFASNLYFFDDGHLGVRPIALVFALEPAPIAEIARCRELHSRDRRMSIFHL